MKALCFLYVCITALLLVSCKVQEDVAEESPAKQASPEQSTAASSKETLPESWVNPPRDEVPKKEYVKPEQAPLVSMGPDGRLVYNAYSDKGDRILDFSTCGYKASEEPIPNIPAVVTLTPPAGEAVPDGNMAYPKGPDSVELIQNALDKVDAMNPGNDGFRGAVLLKKGTWYVNGSLRIGSGVVLRGEGDGENGTVLIFKGAGGKGTGIQLGNPKGRAGSAGSPTRITDHYVPSGAVRFTVEDPGLFKVGDDVRIVKTVNEQWVEDIGCGERLRHIRGGKEGAFKNPWKPGSYQFRIYRTIAGIEGNTMILDMMIPQSIAEEHGGGTVQKATFKRFDSLCGVESLSVVSDYDTTVKDESKSSNFMNLKTGIGVNCINGWVRDCTVRHTIFAAVNINDGRFNTVMNVKSLEQVGPVRGGRRYPFTVGGGSHALFYNCYVDTGRHSFAGGSRVQGPNAFVKCTAVKGGQSEPHHRWGTAFLYDYITLEKSGTIAAINRGDSGSGHGWAAANTVVWNAYAAAVVVFDPETEGENNFAIGSRGSPKEEHNSGAVKYANTRAGYWGTPREGAYYGYPLMGNGYIESPDQPVEPASLFVQQLIDRIGREKAMRVLH